MLSELPKHWWEEGCRNHRGSWPWVVARCREGLPYAADAIGFW